MVPDVVDEPVLFVAPVVLGGGRRLVPPDVHLPLRLVSATAAGTGAIVTVCAR